MRKINEELKEESLLVDGCENIKVEIFPKNEFLDGCIIKTGYKSTINFYNKSIQDGLASGRKAEYQFNGIEEDGRYVFEILREVPFVPVELEGLSQREINEIYQSIKKSPIYEPNTTIVR